LKSGSAQPVDGKLLQLSQQKLVRFEYPVAMIWSGALMLDFLGQREAHDAIVTAIENVLRKGPRTPDLGGRATTQEIGAAITEMI